MFGRRHFWRFLIGLCVLIGLASCSAGEPDTGQQAPDTQQAFKFDDWSVVEAVAVGNEAQDLSPPATLLQKDTRILSCAPGCRLNFDSSDAPIVPDWCLSWEPIMEQDFSVRDHDEAGGVVDRTVRFVPFEKAEGERKYVCTKIDLDQVRTDAQFAAGGALLRFDINEFFKDRVITNWNGEELGMACLPGCVDEAVFDRSNTSELLKICALTPRANRDVFSIPLCMRIKFADINYNGVSAD